MGANRDVATVALFQPRHFASDAAMDFTRGAIIGSGLGNIDFICILIYILKNDVLKS